MNNSVTGIIITSAAERKIEGDLKLVLISQLSSSLGRKLHAKEESGVPSTRIVRLTIKNLRNDLCREEDSTLSQISSDNTRSHLVLRESSSGLLIR